jgi:hypothetical protein
MLINFLCLAANAISATAKGGLVKKLKNQLFVDLMLELVAVKKSIFYVFWYYDQLFLRLRPAIFEVHTKQKTALQKTKTRNNENSDKTINCQLDSSSGIKSANLSDS